MLESPPASVNAGGAVSLLRRLVEIESPTGSPGVVEVAEVMADELRLRGADASVLEGGHLRAELAGDGEPLALIGHCDTVWPEGTLATMPFAVDGDLARGPGVYDMKACLVLMLAAIDEAGPAVARCASSSLRTRSRGAAPRASRCATPSTGWRGVRRRAADGRAT